MRKTGLLFILVVLIMLLAACGGNDAAQQDRTASKNDVAESKQEESPGEPGESGQENSEENKKQEEKTSDSNDAGESEDVSSSSDSGGDSKTGEKKQAGKEKTPSIKVNLLVTKNFGREVVMDKEVALKEDDSVYDILKANADISTSHGGAFIDAINGIEATSGGFGGDRKDWLYYVNGIFTDIGAMDYFPRAGDMVWWDYHKWRGMAVYPAVTGCFPQPFVNGYEGKNNPTVIMHTENTKELAVKLKNTLQKKGAPSVQVKNAENKGLEDRRGPVIVIGKWSELQGLDYLAGLNKAYRKNGMSVHFTGEEIELLDPDGKAARTVSGNSAVITATGEGSGDAAPLWLIAGTGEKGLEDAVNLLAGNPQKIYGCYGAAFAGGEFLRLPRQ